MIRDWWQQLAPREQMMVAGCAVFIVLALIWSMVIQPLYTGRTQLAQEVATKQGQLANFQELAGRIAPTSVSGASPNPGNNDESIVVIIDRTTRNRAIASYLKRNQPEGTAGVRLRFEGAPFDELVEWLGELSQSYGLVAVTANFDEAGTGRVNCSLVLTRGGA
jgi:general secretion pathway protein M